MKFTAMRENRIDIRMIPMKALQEKQREDVKSNSSTGHTPINM